MNFIGAAKDIFMILRSYDYQVMLYDHEGNKVYEPQDARYFFAVPENILVSLTDNNEDSSVSLHLGKNTDIHEIRGLLDTLRTMTTKYAMVFRVHRHGRVITPKDFAASLNILENERLKMNILEGMYGTSRSSYLKLENAKMIIRHSKKIDENQVGARGRNIDAIYVENGQGERHRFCVNLVAPARAMAHHVNHGGSWADPIGAQISRMAQDFSNLGQLSSHMNMIGGRVIEQADADNVRDDARRAMRELRQTFESLCRHKTYDATCEQIREAASHLVESEIDEGRINAFREAFSLDEAALPEELLDTAARQLQIEAPRRIRNVTHVYGREVDTNAWEAFKSGRIDFVQEPDFRIPDFHDTNSEMAYTLSEIAGFVEDDSLANLFSSVADDLQKGRYDKRLVALTKKAYDIAGIPFPSMKSEAFAEFTEWAAQYVPDRVLIEDARMEPVSHDDRMISAEEALDTVIAEFDMNAFLDSEEASDIMWADRLILDDEELEIEMAIIKRALDTYLTSRVEEISGEQIDVTSDVDHLALKVADHMIKDGFIIHEAQVHNEDFIVPKDKDEDKLDRSDIIKKNPGDDLIGEITKAQVKKTDGRYGHPDDDYVNSLKDLVGSNPTRRR